MLFPINCLTNWLSIAYILNKNYVLSQEVVNFAKILESYVYDYQISNRLRITF